MIESLDLRLRLFVAFTVAAWWSLVRPEEGREVWDGYAERRLSRAQEKQAKKRRSLWVASKPRGQGQ